MATHLQRGFDLLNRVMQPAAAVLVSYSREGSLVNAAMPALFDAQQMEIVTEGGLTIVGRQFQFQIKRDELVVDDEITGPRNGDRVAWTNDAKTYVFDLMPSTGQVHEANVDLRSEWLPVNAKLVGVE